MICFFFFFLRQPVRTAEVMLDARHEKKDMLGITKMQAEHGADPCTALTTQTDCEKLAIELIMTKAHHCDKLTVVKSLQSWASLQWYKLTMT